MSNRTDIVVETDNAEGQVLLSASRVYDLTEDKTQDTINSEVRNTLNSKADQESLALKRSGSTNTGAQIENGTYFYLDGILKRAIATIATNASFTAQNCETVTAGGLNSLRDVFRNATPLSDNYTTLSQLETAIQNYYITMPNTYCAYSVVTFKCAEAPFISTDTVFALLFKWSNDWGVGCAFSIGGSANRIIELRNRGGAWSFVVLHDA